MVTAQADAASAASRELYASGPVASAGAPACVVALGHQVLPKNEINEAPHGVDVGILCFRFPAQETDMLCTLNVPALRGSRLRRDVSDLAAQPGMAPLAAVAASLTVDLALFGVGVDLQPDDDRGG